MPPLQWCDEAASYVEELVSETKPQVDYVLFHLDNPKKAPKMELLNMGKGGRSQVEMLLLQETDKVVTGAFLASAIDERGSVMSVRRKYIQVIWVGPRVGIMLKGKVNTSFSQSFKDRFPGCAMYLQLSDGDLDDMQADVLEKTLLSAGGAHKPTRYSFTNRTLIGSLTLDDTDADRQREKEAQRQQELADARRRATEVEARRKAEAEAKRLAEEEAQRKAADERRKAEEERIAKLQGQEEARRAREAQEAEAQRRKSYEQDQKLKALTPKAALSDKGFIMLISSMSGNMATSSNQALAKSMLECLEVVPEIIDGADPNNKDTRNELFTISGLRGKYPQFFLRQPDGTIKFFGDFETLAYYNDTGTLAQQLGGCASPTNRSATSSSASHPSMVSTLNGNKLLLLISSMSGNTATSSNQTRVQGILKGLHLPKEEVEVMDGCDPEVRERRNELFGISGIRAKYPQLFLVNIASGNTTFVGNYDDISYLHDTNTFAQAVGLTTKTATPTILSTLNGKKLLLLISSMSGSLEVSSNQTRVQGILKGLHLPKEKVEVMDGCDPAIKDRRNELFGISGIRAKYPQLFLVDTASGETSFVGNYDDISYLHDTNTFGQALGMTTKTTTTTSGAAAAPTTATATSGDQVPAKEESEFPSTTTSPPQTTPVPPSTENTQATKTPPAPTTKSQVLAPPSTPTETKQEVPVPAPPQEPEVPVPPTETKQEEPAPLLAPREKEEKTPQFSEAQAPSTEITQEEPTPAEKEENVAPMTLQESGLPGPPTEAKQEEPAPLLAPTEKEETSSQEAPHQSPTEEQQSLAKELIPETPQVSEEIEPSPDASVPAPMEVEEVVETTTEHTTVAGSPEAADIPPESEALPTSPTNASPGEATSPTEEVAEKTPATCKGEETVLAEQEAAPKEEAGEPPLEAPKSTERKVPAIAAPSEAAELEESILLKEKEMPSMTETSIAEVATNAPTTPEATAEAPALGAQETAEQETPKESEPPQMEKDAPLLPPTKTSQPTTEHEPLPQTKASPPTTEPAEIQVKEAETLPAASPSVPEGTSEKEQQPEDLCSKESEEIQHAELHPLVGQQETMPESSPKSEPTQTLQETTASEAQDASKEPPLPPEKPSLEATTATESPSEVVQDGVAESPVPEGANVEDSAGKEPVHENEGEGAAAAVESSETAPEAPIGDEGLTNVPSAEDVAGASETVDDDVVQDEVSAGNDLAQENGSEGEGAAAVESSEMTPEASIGVEGPANEPSAEDAVGSSETVDDDEGDVPANEEPIDGADEGQEAYDEGTDQLIEGVGSEMTEVTAPDLPPLVASESDLASKPAAEEAQ